VPRELLTNLVGTLLIALLAVLFGWIAAGKRPIT